MPVENRLQKILLNLGTETIVRAGPALTRALPLRRAAVSAVEAQMHARLKRIRPISPRPPGVDDDRILMGLALLHTVERAVAEQHLAPAALRGVIQGLVQRLLLEQGDQSAKARFRAEYGVDPPDFLVISPGKACNLRCIGCYASSGRNVEKLDWEVFDRVITEAKTLWGARFFTISGGEPLAYRSDGKGVLNAAEKHHDCFFLMYTNGTLVDERMAERMAATGNLTPAISVEGLEERTDARRGKGVFQRVLAAMASLREAGVPFGLSLTATSRNYREILSDEFVDFFFGEQGALYAWIFHYMPIGRGYDPSLMPTPEQRVWLWRRSWELVKQRHIFVADFWTFGTVSHGCISAGRAGGYLYIDWNGKVMPCVFFPYSPVNIVEVYQNGGTLNDVWAEPFFQAIREWQDEYGFGKERPEEHGNWLMPCPIRDHYAVCRELVERYHPEPEDEAAELALLDGNYYEEMLAYDEALAQATDGIWKREYLGIEDTNCGGG